MSDDRVKQAEERLATLRKVTKAEGALDSANATHYDWQKEVQPYAEVAAEMAQFISVSVVSWLRKTTSTEYDVTGVDLLLSAAALLAAPEGSIAHKFLQEGCASRWGVIEAEQELREIVNDA